MEKGVAQETIDSELMLFAPVPVNRSTERVSYVEYRPTNQLTQSSPVEISIPGHSTQYLDLRRCKLNVKCKVVKADGTSLAAEDVVTPVNMLLHTLWDKIDVSLQQKLVTSGSSGHSYRAYLDALLNCGKPQLESVFQAQMFFKDTAHSINETEPDGSPTNFGLLERNKLAKNSQTIDMTGNLFTDLNFDRYLINGISVLIRLHQTGNAFRLITKNEAAQYKVELTEVVFKACQVTVAPEILAAHNTALSKHMALYPFVRTELKAFAIPQGSYSFASSDIFLGSIPTKLVCCFVSAAAYSGSYTTNPFNLHHYNINFLSLTIDGQSVPGRPFMCNFKEGKGQNYIEAYTALFSGLRKEEEDSGLDINR